jgi:hypothetical protein
VTAFAVGAASVGNALCGVPETPIDAGCAESTELRTSDGSGGGALGAASLLSAPDSVTAGGPALLGICTGEVPVANARSLPAEAGGVPEPPNDAADRSGAEGLRACSGTGGGVLIAPSLRGATDNAAAGVTARAGTCTAALQTGQRPDRPAQASATVSKCPLGQVSSIDMGVSWQAHCSPRAPRGGRPHHAERDGYTTFYAAREANDSETSRSSQCIILRASRLCARSHAKARSTPRVICSRYAPMLLFKRRTWRRHDAKSRPLNWLSD